jgi:hypothetical protein
MAPAKLGQILKVGIHLPTFDSDEAFILSSQPNSNDEKEILLIHSVTEFLRSNANGKAPEGHWVRKTELVVIADSLEEWVKSWNE